MLIREVTPEDAESFVRVVKNVESTSDFMMMELEERKTTAEKQRALLEDMDQQSNAANFAAENEEGR